MQTSEEWYRTNSVVMRNAGRLDKVDGIKRLYEAEM